MKYNWNAGRWASLATTAALTLSTTARDCAAQFTAADWNIRTVAFVHSSAANTDGDVDVDGIDFLALQRDDIALLPTPWEADFATNGPTNAGSVVTDITDSGFRYIAQNNDKHLISQKFDTPFELNNNGDKVTLTFNLVANSQTDATGNGPQTIRFWMFDSNQDSTYVNDGASLTNGSVIGSGGDGFAAMNYLKTSSDPTNPSTGGVEQFIGVATDIGSDNDYYGDSSNSLAGNTLRNNTGGQLNDAFHYVGFVTTDQHLMEISVTRLQQGLYLLENNHTNLSNVVNGSPTSFILNENERLFSDLWRDPTDDSLGFDGFSFVVNDRGENGAPFDLTLSNIQIQKTNVNIDRPAGVNSQGIFHLDFLARKFARITGGQECNHCWIEQDDDLGVDTNDFTWAPFVLEVDPNDPAGFDPDNNVQRDISNNLYDTPANGFVNPSLNYGDVFENGTDLVVTVDVPKVKTSNFTGDIEQYRLAANDIAILDSVTAAGSGDDVGTISLTLAAGAYEVETYHLDRDAGANGGLLEAEVSVLDATGSSIRIANQPAGHNTSGFDHFRVLETALLTVNSNGLDPVVITYKNIGTGDFPINGLTIKPIGGEFTAVPEPHTLFAASALLVAGLGRRNRRRDR